MKQYNHFGEYMFDLLFGPLKKGTRAVNQFYIFFKVIGRVFDTLKKDALRVRDETSIATASPVMLPVHGQDRNMPRFAGEDIEAYRTRLAMKGIISEWGGTRKGLLYVLTALGYEQARIEPVGPQDSEHWAEFTANLGVGNASAVRDVSHIYDEIQTIKEGSSRLATLIITSPTFYGQIPIATRPVPRTGRSAPPRYRPALPAGHARSALGLGMRYSTVTLPMAAQKGGQN